jgi:hypothetical protein
VTELVERDRKQVKGLRVGVVCLGRRLSSLFARTVAAIVPTSSVAASTRLSASSAAPTAVRVS